MGQTIVKKPDQCADLAEVRVEIDRIDRDVIAALGERFLYVNAAAKFKKNRGEVAAPERVTAMLEQRRKWAAGAGLHPDVVERIYRELVSYFVTEEQREFGTVPHES
jgi:isochorismate pyruvate lyase